MDLYRLRIEVADDPFSNGAPLDGLSECRTDWKSVAADVRLDVIGASPWAGMLET